MTDEAFRLRVWIRDYGHKKQPAFIRDLTAVLDELDDAKQRADANAADAARWRELTRREEERRQREAAENAELREALKELHDA